MVLSGLGELCEIPKPLHHTHDSQVG